MKNIVVAILSGILFICLLSSVFLNISYPLFWQDEGSTAIGASRVAEYGYPKVHGGKNIYNDMQMDTTISINKKDGSLVGGANWGQYYFGVIGYKLSEKADDIYAKTGIFRSTFAILGLIGLALWVVFMMRFCAGRFQKNLFLLLFLFLTLLSIALTLLLREIRYYAIILFCSSLIMGLYANFRFYKPFNKITFIALEVIALFITFISYSPAYVAAMLTLGLSELIIFVSVYTKTKSRKVKLQQALKNGMPMIILAIASIVSIIPMMYQYKYFEVIAALRQWYGFSFDIYKDHLSTIFSYFKTYGFLWLAMVMKIFVLWNAKKLMAQKTAIFKASLFLTLFFFATVFVVAGSPQMMYTRYFVCVLPVVSIIMIFDAFMIIHCITTGKTKTTDVRYIVLALACVGLFISTFVNVMPKMKDHLYEMKHQCKGPLDYTIPYILAHFPRADTLVIAANYEEYPYMYYLDAKVLIGYAGTNIAEEIKLVPDIIAYRKPWQTYLNIFNGYLQKANYLPVSFPVRDELVNNIAELNFMPALNHRFRTVETQNPQEMTYLYVKSDLMREDMK